MFAPCSRDAFVAALERARTIRLAAYILRSGRLLDALETAAQRGARVRVDLEGEPYARDPAMRARLHALNCASAAALRERGARVDVHDASDAPLHVKAAVLDGALFLDDRNWPQDEADTIVRTTTRADVARVRSALDGKPRSGRSLATRKDAALALEAQTIRSAGADRIECESESFAPSPVSRALLEQARRGARVRLLICERDLAGGNKRGALTALRALAMAGAEIRLGPAEEKLCVTAAAGWAGSANATAGDAHSLDWGLQTKSRPLLHALQSAFNRNWTNPKNHPLYFHP